MERLSAYDVLAETVDVGKMQGYEFEANPAYEKYLRMQKILVGRSGAEEVEQIYHGLKHEDLPAYLAAAGSAAIEASLVRSDKPVDVRLGMLRGAAGCFIRAIRNQRALDVLQQEPFKDTVMAHRVALDLATLPLLEGIVFGAVRPDTNKQVFEDCLNVAQSNAVQINLAKRAQDKQALSNHVGVGYECNALLAFNRMQSNTWFMIPSLGRADTGYHHRQQTHDMLVVHQKWGEIQSMTPVEIKASASRRDRERYKALLVRGKMHLSVEGRHQPETTLAALSAVYESEANVVEVHDTDTITHNITGMVRDYYAGEKLGDTVASQRSCLNFHDNSIVVLNYAGVAA